MSKVVVPLYVRHLQHNIKHVQQVVLFLGPLNNALSAIHPPTTWEKVRTDFDFDVEGIECMDEPTVKSLKNAVTAAEIRMQAQTSKEGQMSFAAVY
jgi:hypothetical protein